MSNCPVSKKTDLDEFDQLVYQQIKARSKMGLHTEPRLNIDLVLRESSNIIARVTSSFNIVGATREKSKNDVVMLPIEGPKSTANLRLLNFVGEDVPDQHR